MDGPTGRNAVGRYRTLHDAVKQRLPIVVYVYKFNVDTRQSVFMSQSARTELQPLQPAANSIVCTDAAAQLLQLFNEQNVAVSSPVRFPTRRCSVSQARCKRCLNQTRCQTQGTDERVWLQSLTVDVSVISNI